MHNYFKTFQLLALATMFSAAMAPTFAFADHGTGNPGQSHVNVPGNECVNVNPALNKNPHCTGNEVPLAVIYPALGAATLAVAMYNRNRRETQGVIA